MRKWIQQALELEKSLFISNHNSCVNDNDRKFMTDKPSVFTTWIPEVTASSDVEEPLRSVYVEKNKKYLQTKSNGSMLIISDIMPSIIDSVLQLHVRT